MTVTKSQIECPGHDWDNWDERQHRSEMQCQFCWVTEADWLEHVETQLARLQELLKPYEQLLEAQYDNSNFDGAYYERWQEVKAALDKGGEG
jgi:hypothetical protein